MGMVCACLWFWGVGEWGVGSVKIMMMRSRAGEWIHTPRLLESGDVLLFVRFKKGGGLAVVVYSARVTWLY